MTKKVNFSKYRQLQNGVIVFFDDTLEAIPDVMVYEKTDVLDKFADAVYEGDFIVMNDEKYLIQRFTSKTGVDYFFAVGQQDEAGGVISNFLLNSLKTSIFYINGNILIPADVPLQ